MPTTPRVLPKVSHATVTMQHTGLAKHATVLKTAFDRVWSKRGWTEVTSGSTGLPPGFGPPQTSNQ